MPATQAVTVDQSTQKQSRRFGLWGKLILAILAAGTIPILVGLSVAYLKGRTELQEVIGASFQALAEDSASRVDAELQRIIAGDRLVARQAAIDPEVRNALLTKQSNTGSGHSSDNIIRFYWPIQHRSELEKWVLKTSWVMGASGGVLHNDVEKPDTTGRAATSRVSGLRLGGEGSRFLFHISSPILEQKNQTLIGWLHREYNVKNLLDPLVYPIRFGETGHVMLIDNLGAIVSCPLLVTGSRINNSTLITSVTQEKAGWITAENDGHGGRKFSIVGHAPLAGVNPLLPAGMSWHMFVWQDSKEIFAPAKSLMIGVALAGVLAIGLLVVLGYYASHRIVNPIRRLREEVSHIAHGDLNRTLNIQTGDEIEELAGEFNDMRLQLRQLIGNLEDKVEERTRELKDTQVEKDRVIQQLIQTEKLTAIGTMASGIGHEINNPLYAILGMAEAIRDEDDLSHSQNHGQEIIKHARHIAEIVKNLSGYIRPASDPDLEVVDINEKLTEAISMVQRSLISDHIEIKTSLLPVPKVVAKQEEIQQAFFNIIRNGIQAMQDQGILTISSAQKDQQIVIQIQDHGSGIPMDHQGKIFDPFFTTKGPDEGEGLGLYIVQQILKKYHGKIALESQQGVGTTFTIYFPIEDKTNVKRLQV